MHKQKDKKYKRILLKLSGEALGSDGLGIDPRILDRMALEVGQLVGIGVQVGLVIGGGNLFRGAALHAAGMDRQVLSQFRRSRRFATRPKCRDIDDRHIAGRDRSGLVHHDGVDGSRVFKYLDTPDDDAQLRSPPRSNHQGSWCGEPQRTRAGDDQHGHRGGNRGRR